MALSITPTSSLILHPSSSSSSSPPSVSTISFSTPPSSHRYIANNNHNYTYSTYPSVTSSKKWNRSFICRAEVEYKFPDPIPEFADEETEKFRTHLLEKLSKKDLFGESVEEIVQICTEIFDKFLRTEYGGPGTLLVDPFIDMADTLNERGLPGGPQAARAAVKWAQKHVDNGWREWTSG